MKERMNEWVNKMNERTNEWDPPSATTAATLPQKIQGFAPESVWKPEFPRSRPRTLTNNFHDDDVVDIWNRAPATVSCTFCRPHLPKVLRDPHFFNIFKWKSSSRFSPVHFLSTTPWSSRETAETEALLWRRKKYRISRPIMFSSLNSRALDFLNTSQLLAWWCEQSGSRSSLVHIVPTSSSKSAPRPSVFFIILSGNQALATVSCTSSSKSAPRPSVFVTFSQVETELALQSRTPFADWKVPRDPQCFSIFKCKSSSRFSLVHLLPTSFYRSAPRREIELSLQCCAHFVGLIFQKCFETLSFLTFSSGNRALASVLLHFLSTTFPDRAAQLRKQRPSFGDK